MSKPYTAQLRTCLCPPVARRSTTEIVFDASPLGTFDQLLTEAQRRGETLDYASALGLGALTAEAYAAARRARPDAASGRLCAGQIVLGRRSRIRFIGITTPLCLDRRPDGTASPFVAAAPELLRGQEADAGSDVYAAAHLAVRMAPFLRFPEALGEALGGGAGSDALLDAARYFDRHVATHVMSERARDLRDVLARFEDAWSASGLTWSASDGERALSRIGAELLQSSMQTLEVEEDASRFRRGLEERVSLKRRTTLRGLLAALVDDHQKSGPGLDFDEMIAAGWPQEKVIAAAGRARVHMAVSTLRKLGLGEWLEHEAGRYRIRRSVHVRVG